MFKIRVLSGEDVAKALSMPQVLEAVADAYKAKSKKEAINWPSIFYDFYPGKADVDIKSGYLKNAKRFGHKTANWFTGNVERGLPTLVGSITVFSSETGIPLGLMDSFYITCMRTGAGGALGAKYLARENSENLLILGAGNLALAQIAAMLTAFPHIKKVRVAATTFTNAGVFINFLPKRLSKEFELDVSKVTFEAVKSLRDAVMDSDIIITVTPSKNPLIKKEWVQNGTHFSCLGADMPGKEELDPEIFSSARIFADDKKHVMAVGEMEIPIKMGIINEADVDEIGDLILGKVQGRSHEDDITIFDSAGMAILDLAVAEIALRQAAIHGIGIEASI